MYEKLQKWVFMFRRNMQHGLACFKDRLKALEKHVAETGTALIESQVQALERKKEEEEAHGEIETGHPGYLG